MSQFDSTSTLQKLSAGVPSLQTVGGSGKTDAVFTLSRSSVPARLPLCVCSVRSVRVWKAIWVPRAAGQSPGPGQRSGRQGVASRSPRMTRSREASIRRPGASRADPPAPLPSTSDRPVQGGFCYAEIYIALF